MSEAEIVLILIFCVAVASIRVGWVIAMEVFERRLTKEIRQEIYEEFKKDYFDKFLIAFEEKVELRAREIVEETLKEKENKDEGSGSN
jgi:hypothetical protein